MRLALELELAQVLEHEEPGSEVLGIATDDDLPGSGQRQHPRGQVRGVADRRVVHAKIPADRADDDGAGVDPDAHLEVPLVLALDLVAQGLQVAVDLERGVKRAGRVILVGDRRAEQRHDAVPEKLIDRALVAVNRVQDHLEGAVHDGVDLLGIQALGHRREAGHVGEHHGDLLALSLDGALRREDLLGEMPRGVRGGRGESLGNAGRFRRRRDWARGRRRPGRRGAQAGAALTAELLARRVLVLARGALHPAANLGASAHGVKRPINPAAVKHIRLVVAAPKFRKGFRFIRVVRDSRVRTFCA